MKKILRIFKLTKSGADLLGNDSYIGREATKVDMRSINKEFAALVTRRAGRGETAFFIPFELSQHGIFKPTKTSHIVFLKPKHVERILRTYPDNEKDVAKDATKSWR